MNNIGFDFTDGTYFPPLCTPFVTLTIKVYLANRKLCDDSKYL